ncbi:hypothetical protein [Lentilactobacillus hilgardii]|uniref:Uncharacterized protein n=1 Tax=Lentilactobacillus hilgardii (strain ATCC 8290 / DSM 20176 / CCUG 30140 / JCM 1155 / KCTC 3500 / NBRC 15886 / NCIMB 8040 / NRRL B-1843 / 9) TaxID=1423757 RepID=C0XK64_LENH9|nr:hypothetical protein [Lentilactobacillus hilgardii]EEI20345.1 hypothetical protein HMPREF0497_0835 [Lentilactobacillus buchneri ATCC 11577]EEI24248.1 hypothetical protein HMPREF0519_1625 [Lentilactobacillus hilgardii DSM 20176 = ATCC 8290]KRK56734.1 hypothetical protein FD42_GL000278 [Lentilactobacillus hilgardii DSM 20176 = ATCC 8290]MCT3397052.1 hypothetical protein [Lentilactobacillus hilgardii]MCT3400159.1 hypothetical protein [Lentilactobacillus hilgardii]
MFRKFLFIVTVGLLLFAGLVTVPSSHASTLPGYYSSYWYKPRLIHIKYPVYVYQVNPENSRTNQKMVLLEDSKVQAENDTTFGWVVKAPYLQQKRGYIWIVKGHYSQDWIKW